MPVARLSTGTRLAKAVQSGGGAEFTQPSAWIESAYGPGMSITPSQLPQDADIPRAFDYPMAVNSSLVPRSGYDGLLPFAALYEVYRNVTEAAMIVNLYHRELSSFKPQLVDLDGQSIPDGHPMQWMTQKPDRKTAFNVWLTWFLKSTKIYDAPAVYLKQNGDQITAMNFIDGSTLFLIVDEFGNTPQPETIIEYAKRASVEAPRDRLPINKKAVAGPSSLQAFYEAIRNLPVIDRPDKIPAYTQVIKGTPFSWWSADQVWYRPQNRRINAPYGESFIEQAWPWIMIIVNITSFELAHYRTGNLPEGLLTVPQWAYPTAADVLEAERSYNARMSSGPTERQRLRVFPDGTKLQNMKKPDFPDKLYAQAWKNMLHIAGIPPSEFGDIPGSGLGGKGFKEGSTSDLGRITLNPTRSFIASLFNDVLDRNGEKDVRFDLAYAMDEVDPEKQKESVWQLLSHATYTLNEALSELGMDAVPGSMRTIQHGNGDEEQIPDPDHIANKHWIVAGAAIYVIEDMKVQNGLAVPTFTGKQPPNGAPVGPESAAEQDGAEHTNEDGKTIEKAIRNLLATGTLDGKFYSLPAVAKQLQPDAAKEAVIGLLVDNQNEQAGTLPVDAPDKADKPTEPKPDVQQKPIEKIATIDGLDKHCGVCPEDDEYFGAPVSREVQFAFPADHHANSVEIVAVTPDGLPPKAFVWKPEGGELDSLRARVGGPLYPREEAAYILDRSLGFMLVPVTFVADADGEYGSAQYYSGDAGPGKNVVEYAPEWVERAAVLDYIMSQTDRQGDSHNTLTHPDDPGRMIFIDNGLGFPVDPDTYCESRFCQAMIGKSLSAETLQAIQRCMYDVAAWHDIQTLIGAEATQKARICAQRLLDEKMITAYEHGDSDSD